MPSDRPNILVIMSDQHSKHVLGAYGNEIVRTPHLDNLAQRGMRFDACYCPSPLCVPSRMSFSTGRTPSQNRVWTNRHSLGSNIPTWAHSLGTHGYETALIGRMHFVGPDQRHGFEKRPLGTYFGAPYPGAPTPGAPLFRDIPASTSGQQREGVEISGYGTTTYQAFDDLVTDAAVDYLEGGRDRDTDRPFATVVGYVLPHCPYFVPKDLFDYYYERVDIPVPSDEELAREPEPVSRFKRLRGLDEPLSEERIRIARAAYFGMVEYMDRNIGRVLDALRRSGEERDTLVLYTSDHGECAGEHGCWWKSNYYEASVSVPLIASMPGRVPESGASGAVCNLYDVGPTLIELAGARALPGAAGRSFLPALVGGDTSDRVDETFSEYYGGDRDERPSRMIRSGPWKLYMYDGDDAPVLFNLDDDPGEMVDLGGEPSHADVRDDLLARLHVGWEPDVVASESDAMHQDWETLVGWGAAVRPGHEDMIDVPDVEDVTIL